MKKLVKRLFTTFIKFLDRSKKTIFLILIVAAMTITLTSAISIWLSRVNHLYIPSLGNIRTYGVEAYEGNIATIDGKQHIDWGTTYPGTLTNRSFYLRSKSNTETTLNLETANWTFQDSDGKNVTEPTNSYINLTWNYTNTPISPNEEIYVTLTLQASNSDSFINYLITNDVTEFSFDICIYASKE